MKKIVFCFVLLLLLSCNNDKEIVNAYNRRIVKINMLTTSSNADTYFLNSLDDSLRIINSELNTLEIEQANKDILIGLIDSVSKNIHIARVTNCLIGNEFTSVSEYNKEKLIEVLGDKRDVDEILIGMLAAFDLRLKVVVKNNYECDVICQVEGIGRNIPEDASWGYGGYSTSPVRRSITKGELYKYIGNDEFQLSNGWIIKVNDPQSCEVDLLTDSGIKKRQETKPRVNPSNSVIGNLDLE